MNVKLLMTISGIGYYTGLLIKVEVGDVRIFGAGDSLCATLDSCPPPTHREAW